MEAVGDETVLVLSRVTYDLAVKHAHGRGRELDTLEENPRGTQSFSSRYEASLHG